MVNITSWAELDAMRSGLGGNYTLLADLDENSPGYDTYAGPLANGGAGWDPVGTAGGKFTGTFDGNGHTISDLYINRGATDEIGLFGFTGAAAVINDVALLNVNITGDDYTGALAGRNEGAITNSYSTGSVSGPGAGRTGGLVGMNEGTINASYSAAAVAGFTRVGGLAGQNLGGTISDSYAQGSVNGNNRAGGLVGTNTTVSISRCFSTGAVTGSTQIGGLVGENFGTVNNSFWDTQTSGQSSSAGGTGKTTAEMQTLATFTAAGWDIVIKSDWFDEAWFIDENNDYPRLGWQFAGPLPTTVVKNRDAVYIMLQLLNAMPYSEDSGGNVIIKGSWDVEEDIPAPSIIVTNLNLVPIVLDANGNLDQITETLQLDLFAASEQEVNNLRYEVEKVIAAHRREPGRLLPAGSIFALELPGPWVNNDALNQAEGLNRRTNNIDFIRFRGA